MPHMAYGDLVNPQAKPTLLVFTVQEDSKPAAIGKVKEAAPGRLPGAGEQWKVAQGQDPNSPSLSQLLSCSSTDNTRARLGRQVQKWRKKAKKVVLCG